MAGEEGDCSFEWDETSNLYFHASSGFYHDPTAGWYYSSRDGLYYSFENGEYVPFQFGEEADSVDQQTEPVEDQPCEPENVTDDRIEIQTPSQCLEETTINLCLSGHSQSEVTPADSSALQIFEEVSCCDLDQIQDETMPEDMQALEMTKVATSEEENWLAQYGQAVSTAQVIAAVPFPVIDMWDWEMVAEADKDGHQVAKLSGRLTKRSTKLHPSVSSRGGRLKTASICDVHLDLVRVASGKIYRLKTPSRKYLASLSTYDSSNPTKVWGFPNFSVEMLNQTLGSNCKNSVTNDKSNATDHTVSKVTKQRSSQYRDRAAERRSLHGEFSIGPGQKNVLNGDSHTEEPSSPTCDGEEAAAEAMSLTFGQGSYARTLLEKMGWKDGESLGSNNKGIVEPLQAIGNRGNSGLGWKNIR